MAIFNPKSLKAEEFINDEEIRETLAYAEANKNNVELIDQILEKARPQKTETGCVCAGLTHREASVLLACEIPEKIEKMYEIAKQCGRLSSIISIFKSSVTKYAIKNDIHFGWQTRFYDRIIRDYNEFINIDNYIKNNVINWKDDEFYPNRLHQ